MEERRKVLFTNGMSSDYMIIITDAPKEAIEKWCYHYNQEMEDGKNTYFDTLKKYYSVKVLVDSETHDFDRDDMDIIGYDETYDLCDYVSGLFPVIEGFRTVKLTAGMMQEFEIISTNAPDSVIKAQLTYINACEEAGEPIENPYSVIEAMGYEVNVLGCQDDFSSEDMEIAVIDAEFDYYKY